ncbi:MAG: aminopeptidase, partial [Pseudomonadota bacterium]|nr:aminopeptidase [Pseudomonadota bacterium]
MKAIKIFTLGLCCCLAGGCESLRFYKQAALGQLSLLRQAENVSVLLEDPDTPEDLRERLQLVQSMLQFAEQELKLSVEGRYQRYVSLDQDYVMWSVFVAPPLAMKSVQWCYLVVGCAPYRGYFDEARATAFAANYAAEGFDTYVGRVPAYSTLGWFKDPLLSSFLYFTEPALANLLFHELAHSKVWLKGDVAFNESFASFVGVQGANRWVSLGQDQFEEGLTQWRLRELHWQRFKTFALAAKADLTSLYEGQTGGDAERMQQRQRLLAHWQSCYNDQRARLGNGRFDRFMGERFNNAFLMSLGTYEDWVGAFTQLFADVGEDWPTFFANVKSLTTLQDAQRQQQMRTLRSRHLAQQQE